MAAPEADLKGRLCLGASAEEIIVLIDQHGTIREPRFGFTAHHTKPLTDQQICQLDDVENLGSLVKDNIKILERPKKRLRIPPIKELFSEFALGELRYKNRPDQEKALSAIVQEGLASCTLLSAAEAGRSDWIRWVLGRSGRENFEPSRQMILRKGKHPLFSKMVGVSAVLHGYDLPADNRMTMTDRVIFLVDDDPNFLEAACRYFGLAGFAPISKEQKKKYPVLPLPASLQNKEANIHYDAGLPELHGYLMGIQGRGVEAAAQVIMQDSQFHRLPPRNY